MGRFSDQDTIRTEGKSYFRKRDEMQVSSLKHAIGNASRNESLPSQAQKLPGFMRIVRKVKEMKRCSEKEWVLLLLCMKRGGKAVVEDKTRCNNTPVARA
jgi:hypothetical protein